MGKIIVANWKANPTTLAETQELFDFYLTEISKSPDVQLVVCPPFVYLEELAKKLPITNYQLPITIGAQDLFWEPSGPYTGEISTDMLKNFGVTHVLVGHSDRRYPPAGGGETDEVINKKIKAALETRITPVLLVGEQNHGDDRKQVLEAQLVADLVGLTAEQISKILITYEPVWAISTNLDAEADTPANTLKALAVIQEFLLTSYQLPAAGYQLLYGGSVNSQNIADFLQHPEISGAVIGGASLRKEEFGKILKIVSSND